MVKQRTPMTFDPCTSTLKPYPDIAEEHRWFHGEHMWLINPWTGDRRASYDVLNDPFGHLIIPTGEQQDE